MQCRALGRMSRCTMTPFLSKMGKNGMTFQITPKGVKMESTPRLRSGTTPSLRSGTAGHIRSGIILSLRSSQL